MTAGEMQTLGLGFTWEQLSVGQKFRTLNRTITEADLMMFVGCTGMDLAKGEQRTEAYLKMNPLGRVPLLQLDNGDPLAENTAILPYLGKRFNLWPSGPEAEAKALSLIGFFASSVHPAHAHVGRPERYTADQSAHPGIKEQGLKTFHGDRVDHHLVKCNVGIVLRYLAAFFGEHDIDAVEVAG